MTGSRGPRGYPDFQRVENYDGLELFVNETLTVAKGVTKGIGPKDVSRYAAVKIRAVCTAGAGVLKLSYASDEPTSAFIGKREIVMSSTAGSTAILEISNLGPEFSIEWEGLETTNSVTFTVVPTNRNVMREAVPPTSVLSYHTASLAPSGGVTFQVPSIATGTGHLLIVTLGDAEAEVILITTTVTNEEIALSGVVTEAGKELTVLEFPLPLGPVKLQVVNGATKQEIRLILTSQ